MKKILTRAALAFAVCVPALSQATVINFGTLGTNHSQNTPVDGATWASLGIVFSSPQGLVTACGGTCLTAGANSYRGEVIGSFVFPSSSTAATVNELSITAITGSARTQLFDISNNLIGSYASSFSYSGSVGVARFSTIENYDAFSSMSFNNLTPVNVPEPASLALVGVGLLGVAAARRRKQ
jgi:hypothetical protein